MSNYIKFLVTAWVMFSAALVYGQASSSPVFYFSPTPITGAVGSTVNVDVKVDSFVNIVGYSFSLNWDPTILQYNSFSQNFMFPPTMAVATNNASNGVISSLWTDNLAQPQTVDNGTTLFSIEFTILDNSTEDAIEFVGSPTSIEVIGTNSSGNIIDITNEATLVCGSVNPSIPGLLTFDSCPSNINATASGGTGTATVTWTDPTISSTCPVDCGPYLNQLQGPPNGGDFPIGTTTVQYEAYDGCGNIINNCMFDVVVTAGTNSVVTLTCPGDVTVQASAGQNSAVANWTAPTPTTDCPTGPTPFTATQTNGLASGSAFSIAGSPHTITYEATDDCGVTETCSFQVIVNAAPAFAFDNCPTDITVTAPAGSTSMPVSWTTITATSACTGGATVTQLQGPINGSNFPIGSTTVIFQGTDNCGNSVNCEFDVIVNSAGSNLTISCPADISQTAGQGQSSMVVNWSDATATSQCPLPNDLAVTQTAGPPSGSVFAVGTTTTITYEATDNCGNMTTCSFLVSVNAGSSNINLTCPGNVVVTAPAGQSTAIASWGNPSGTTDCPLGGLIFNQTSGPTSGSAFNVNTTTTIEYTATDDCGGSTTCTFTVEVIEGVPCPATGFGTTASKETAETGEIVCLDISVCNFDEIISMQYTIDWDVSLLQYNSVTNFNLPQLNASSFGYALTNNGQLTFSWNDSLGVGTTVPDGEVIYSVCYTVIGAGGGLADVSFSSSFTPIEITDANSGGQHIGFEGTDGCVGITGDNSSALSVAGECVEAMPGDGNVCIPFVVQNFEDMSGLQYTMNWDPTLMTFSSVGAFNLQDLNLSMFNLINPGELTLSWSVFGPGVDVMNETAIYEVCFDIDPNAAIGSSISVDITGSPLAIEASQTPVGTGIPQVIPIITNPGKISLIGEGVFELSVGSGNDPVCPGESICLDVTVEDGFSGVNNFGYAHQWDPAVLGSPSIQNINTYFTDPLLGNAPLQFNQNGNNKLLVIWGNPTPGTLPNGTVLYQLCFNSVGTDGTTSAVDFVDPNPPFFNIEVGDDNGQPLPFTFTDGMVSLLASACANPLDVTAEISDVNCNGGNDGEINLSVSGGIAAYTFAWSNGSVMEDLSGLTAGNYTVTVTDNVPQTVVVTFTVDQPSAISVTSAVTEVTCFNDTDGAIDLTVGGGTAPYTYNWDPAIAGNPEDPTGLAAGPYAVTIMDDNGCTEIRNIQVTQPTAINITGDVTNVSCLGDANGAIDVTLAGGTPPYTITWDDPLNNGMEDLSMLNGGTYFITVTDARNCEATNSFTITEPTVLTLAANVTNATCDGDDGAIDLVVNGGTPNYSFDWSNDIYDGMEDLSVIGAGVYEVTITDDNGCTVSTNVTIVTDDLSVEGVTIDVFCNGQSNGAINLTVTGNATPFTYVWDDAQYNGQEDILNVSAGTYCVTVTDANDCSAEVCQTVNEPEVLEVTAMVTDADCTGGNGCVDLTVTGGTAPYSFNWSDNQYDGMEDPCPIDAGTYTVIVTDARGCQTTTSITVSVINIALTGETTDISCAGADDGSIDLTVTGTTALPLNYTWSATQFNGQEDPSGLAPGAYNVTVTDDNNCTATASFSISEPTELMASVTTTPVTCNGGDGNIDLTVMGGTLPYDYNWSVNQYDDIEDPMNVNAGTYIVVVTDANGCDVQLSAVVGTADITLSAIVTDVTCGGGNDGAIDLTVNGTNATPFNYTWNDPMFNGQEDLTGLVGGTYCVTITDDNGCTASNCYDVSDAGSLDISATTTNASCNGGDGGIDLTIIGGSLPYSFDWSGGLPNIEDPLGVDGGSYTVTVTDANDCASSFNVTVFTDNFTTSIEGTDVSCNGLADGSITLTLVGGTAPFNFTWNDVLATGQNPSNLPAGTYNVTVTDNGGCTATSGVTILQPNPIDINGNVNDETCAGANDGSINLTIVGGATPYVFNWDNTPANGEDPTGLPPNTYMVTVTDNSGCTNTASFTVGGATALSVSINVMDIGCDGGTNDGAIDITATGGTGAYNYDWDNGLPNTEDQSNLGPGTYTVTVTDGNNCEMIVSGTINAGGGLSLNMVSTNVTCEGEDDGTITATVTGGVGTYNYVWDPVQPNTNSLTGLSDGVYNVTVTDDNSCSAVGSRTITEPNELESVATPMHVSCAGANDGSIDLTVLGGTPPYSYDWNNGGPTTQDISGLGAGFNSVVVTDDNGCETTAFVTINAPSAINAFAIPTDVSCNGVCDGSIAVTALGGTPPYNYIWSDASFNGMANPMGMCPGNYTVTIVDALDCEVVRDATIGEPSALIVNTMTIDVTCAGTGDGVVNIQANGGTPPFTFTWSDPAYSQPLETMVAPGQYMITVSDDNGCSVVETAIINDAQGMNINGNVSNEILGNDGAIDVTVTGGASPYTYEWDYNNATTEDLSGLPAGTYNLTVTDDNDCEETASFTVNPANVATITVVSITNVSCNGGNNGAIDINVTGAAPFSFLWSNGDNTEDLSGLPAGTYTVTVTDNNGTPSVSAPININEPNVISFTSTVSNENCGGSNDGAIDLDINGGSSPYMVAWSNGDNTEDITGLAAGSYTPTITDNNGCTFEGTPITVGSAAGLDIMSNVTDAGCEGGADGLINITVTGGTPPYAFDWSNAGETTEDISGLAAGDYTVTVTDNAGCSLVSNIITINDGTAITATSSTTDVGCSGILDGSISLTVSGGTMPYSYLWSNGQMVEDINGLGAGDYTVTITDVNDCVLELGPITVNSTSGISISNISVNDLECNGDANGSIDVDVTGGSGIYTYSWSNSDNTEDISDLVAGTYILSVTDSDDCSFESAPITVSQPSSISVFSVVTDLSCGATTGGEIDITISGGTAPYSVVWNGGETTEDLTGLVAGTYTVEVTDDNGCIFTSNPITVGGSAGLIVSLDNVTNVACAAEANGSIDIDVTGGTAPLSFAWSIPETTEDISGLTAGTYSVVVTDASGCSGELTNIEITEPAPLAYTSVVTDITCENANDGAIDLTITGGSGPYTVNWSNGGSSANLSGLPPGNYLPTIIDANGCSLIGDLIFVTEPAGITISLDITPESCDGNNDGTITLDISGGTEPYEYLWSDPSGSQTSTVGNLPAGNYVVTITDANLCEYTTDAITVASSPELQIIVDNVEHVSCGGANDGTIDITVTGGAMPYSILWSNGSTMFDLMDLAAGVYIPTVTDANGCEVEGLPIVITEGDALALTTQVTNVSCNNGDDGAISVEVTGGTGPYSYAWNPMLPNSDTQLGLDPDDYQVTVTDANGCSVISETMTIQNVAAIGASINVNHLECNGVCDGSIQLDITGGTTPYTYGWSSGAITEDLIDLCAGTYTLTIVDANGCLFVGPPITINDATPLLVESTVTPTAFSGSTGVIDLMVGGGTPDYTYVWAGIGSISSTVTDLSAGDYSVTITDMMGCSQVEIINVPVEFIVPEQFVTITNPPCDDVPLGSIDITVFGGAEPYGYQWMPGGFTTQDLTDVNAGQYTVTVTDNNGLSLIETYTITAPDPFSITLDSIDHETGVGCNGNIYITVDGGTLQYDYLWNNGSTIEDPSDLCKGDYQVTIIDANGCVSISDVYTVLPAALDLSTTSVSNVSCAGGDDGEACFTIIGGCGPYTFDIDGGDQTAMTNENNICFSGLAAGNHVVEVTDFNNVVTAVTFTIDEPTAVTMTVDAITDQSTALCDVAVNISASGGTGDLEYMWSNGETVQDPSGLCEALSPYSVTITDENGCDFVFDEISLPVSIFVESNNVSCNGGSDGSISLTTSGVPIDTYQWNPGNASGANPTNLPAGDYFVTVTDVNGGITELGPIVIGQPNELLVTLNSTTPAGNSNNDGTVDIDVSGGTTDYEYNWNNGATSQDLSGLAGGTYTVTVTDDNGCESSLTVEVGGPEDLGVSITFNNTISCFDDCDGEVMANPTGGSGQYSFQWNDPQNQLTSIATGLCDGIYTVTVTDDLTNLQVTGQVNVAAPNEIEVSIFNVGEDGFEAIVTGGTPDYDYIWTGTTQMTPMVTDLAPGTYGVVVTDANGCTGLAEGGVIGDPDLKCYEDYRSIISPNNDGYNDFFYIHCAERVNNNLQIYNRWGQLVYEADNYDNTFSGQTASGSDLPEEGYFFIFEYDEGGERKRVRGNITIIRR